MRLITRAAYAQRMQRPALLDVERHREPFVERAENGDAVAAMALFHLDGATTIRREAGVSSMIPGDRQAAARWLETAARNGDCEAMTQYARSMQAQVRFAATAMPEHEVAAIGKQVSTFLRTAAERGYRDAFVLLADISGTGTFGRIDLVLALTYRVALNRLDGDASTRRAVRWLERSMPAGDRARASEAASILVRIVRARLDRDRRVVDRT